MGMECERDRNEIVTNLERYQNEFEKKMEFHWKDFRTTLKRNRNETKRNWSQLKTKSERIRNDIGPTCSKMGTRAKWNRKTSKQNRKSEQNRNAIGTNETKSDRSRSKIETKSERHRNYSLVVRLFVRLVVRLFISFVLRFRISFFGCLFVLFLLVSCFGIFV